MKKYSTLRKGFTLVELMIVIAIIGILAAVLYPGFTGFMEGARDTGRTASLKNYSTALLSYNQDNNYYPVTKATHTTPPTAPSSGSGGGSAAATAGFCVKDLYGNHLKKYMPKGIEKDAKGGNGVVLGSSTTCATADEGGYGYIPLATGTEARAAGNAYVLLAKMEKWSNANLDASKAGSGTTAKAVGTIVKVEELDILPKGDAKLKGLENNQVNAYYAVRN